MSGQQPTSNEDQIAAEFEAWWKKSEWTWPRRFAKDAFLSGARFILGQLPAVKNPPSTPECETCGRSKAPRGRDIAAACGADYCTLHNCVGYSDDPPPATI